MKRQFPTLAKIKVAILQLMFPLIDLLLRKQRDHWAFPVGLIGGRGEWRNSRFVYDQAKQINSIHSTVFYRDGDFGFPVENAVRIDSLRGMVSLARSYVVFIHHGSGDFYWKFLSPKRHLIVNLWHGVPLRHRPMLSEKPERGL